MNYELVLLCNSGFLVKKSPGLQPGLFTFIYITARFFNAISGGENAAFKCGFTELSIPQNSMAQRIGKAQIRNETM